MIPRYTFALGSTDAVKKIIEYVTQQTQVREKLLEKVRILKEQ